MIIRYTLSMPETYIRHEQQDFDSSGKSVNVIDD